MVSRVQQPGRSSVRARIGSVERGQNDPSARPLGGIVTVELVHEAGIPEDDLDAVRDVLSRGWLVQGAHVEAFERATAELLGRISQNLIDNRFDGAGIGDLFQTLLFDDGVSVALTIHHVCKHRLGDLSGDGAVVHALQQARQLLWTDWTVGQRGAGTMQCAHQFHQHPVCSLAGLTTSGTIGAATPVVGDTGNKASEKVVSLFEPHTDIIVKDRRDTLYGHKVYLTFDIDCLDPAFAPGTGTPVCGGLSTHQALEIVRGLAGINLVGMDIVEVAPAYDVGEITALAGATLACEFLCLYAANKDRQG